MSYGINELPNSLTSTVLFSIVVKVRHPSELLISDIISHIAHIIVCELDVCLVPRWIPQEYAVKCHDKRAIVNLRGLVAWVL